MPEPAAAPAQGQQEESTVQKFIKIAQVRLYSNYWTLLVKADESFRSQQVFLVWAITNLGT